jgi:two-component system OmpR family sensor kinase
VGSVSGAGTWRATLVDGVSGEKILVAISLDEVDHSTGQLWVAVGAADAATLFVLLIALWWVYRLGLRPIAEVTAAADAITAGDRSRRAQTPRRAGEAAHLAKAFNVMLDERDATEQLLRQFLADASHELRTPITAISGVSQMWRTGALEGASLDDAMRRLGREAIRVRRLVEDLLLLARLDEGAALCPGPFDLRSVVEATTTDVAEVFPGRRFTTTLQSVSMRGDEERIRQVVSNLVTNAFVHTPPSSTLEVTLESSREQVVLRVIDDGPGLNEECADRVFDRFWRADAARTRSGSGLGLAIVKGIVEAHNGSVIFESSPTTGTVVTVVFPVTPA